jgi:hypothetical protein
MFHRLLAICQRKQAEDAPCSLLTSVLNRNLFKQINDNLDLLKMASYVPVSLAAATSAPTEASSADLAPFWQSDRSGSGSASTYYHQQQYITNYMFVSSIEEDAAAAACLFISKNDDDGSDSSSSCRDSDSGGSDSEEFGYFEDEESFA